MISFLRTIFTVVVTVIITIVLATVVVVAAMLGMHHHEGGLFDRIPRFWSRVVLWAAGVKVRLHGLDRLTPGQSYIFAANHVSLFDIPALVCSLPQHYFVAKAELFKVPFFGPGIRAVGTIPIQRSNRKSAFGSYDVAAERIKGGSSVVVFPEGTRGTSYPIRPFKKGPFVLAVQAGVPVIPCLIYGTIQVLSKKSLRIHPGCVDVHLLDPVPITGLSYEDRDHLADVVHNRMASAMHSLYLNS
jgi:1-acyl-sn-glycerol-3-phosphate acyltransferase